MIPSSAFKRARVGHVCDTVLGKMLQTTPKNPGDQEVSYLRAGSLEMLSDLAELPTMFAQDSEVQALGLREGDLLVAEGGDVGRSEMAPRLPQGTIFQNSLHRIRLRAGGDIRFVRYALSSIYSSGWLDVLCNRATFGHLTVEKLRQLHIPWPRPSAQTAIADYLDTETSRIDTLITKKRRMIELIDERKKLQGEEVIASLRESEDCVPLKRLVGESDTRYGAGPKPILLSVSIHHGVVPRDTVTDRPSRSDDYSSYKVCQPGDIAINRMRAFQGGVGVVQLAGVVSPDYTVLRTGRRVSARYLHFVMRSSWFVSEMTRRLRGIGATDQGQVRTPRINYADLGLIQVPVPEVSRQRQISRNLAEQEDRMAQVTKLLAKQVDAIAEHRQAVITAAVMGESVVPADRG